MTTPVNDHAYWATQAADWLDASEDGNLPDGWTITNGLTAAQTCAQLAAVAATEAHLAVGKALLAQTTAAETSEQTATADAPDAERA